MLSMAETAFLPLSINMNERNGGESSSSCLTRFHLKVGLNGTARTYSISHLVKLVYGAIQCKHKSWALALHRKQLICTVRVVDKKYVICKIVQCMPSF